MGDNENGVLWINLKQDAPAPVLTLKSNKSKQYKCTLITVTSDYLKALSV